ncbi:hypothetical protein F3Y22_tig00110013pilonHSYRG00286 [Hibiscus syriacus]|uniref:Uncharacterized protein n=1 Tax=Hibiscus syriacus TaxID=106335 RepID=A0A6A3BNH9_HIBSY|nr:hypothetical protein F3Y22_tig00110013pilonHSYRG00286 [Hibiscus syriacus]
MGCGISKLHIPKGGDPSQLYTRLTIDRDATARRDGVDHKKRGNVEKEEACVDEESSSSEEELEDRDDGVDSFMQAPSFRVYCVSSPIDDDKGEGPDDTKENQNIDVHFYDKGYGKSTNAPRRRERKGFRSRFCRHIYSTRHGTIIKFKGSFGMFSW